MIIRALKIAILLGAFSSTILAQDNSDNLSLKEIAEQIAEGKLTQLTSLEGFILHQLEALKKEDTKLIKIYLEDFYKIDSESLLDLESNNKLNQVLEDSLETTIMKYGYLHDLLETGTLNEIALGFKIPNSIEYSKGKREEAIQGSYGSNISLYIVHSEADTISAYRYVKGLANGFAKTDYNPDYPNYIKAYYYENAPIKKTFVNVYINGKIYKYNGAINFSPNDIWKLIPLISSALFHGNSVLIENKTIKIDTSPNLLK